MTRVVLAYSGGARGSAAIGWLRDRHQAEVIALTVDVGQERDLEEIRERALALGAVRAHVLDRREAFASAAIARLGGAAAPLPASAIAGLALPVVAQALAEVAAIEHATMVAHAAAAGAAGLEAALAGPGQLPIVRVAGEWAAAGLDGLADARARGVPLPAPAARWTASRHLLCRPVAASSASPAGSSIELDFADGVPVAVNGVAFAPAELLECLSLLGGRHGIGRVAGEDGVIEAPAAAVLEAAYAVLRPCHGAVRVTLREGSCTAAHEPTPSHLVNHA